MGCYTVFGKDPNTFLVSREIELSSLFDEARPAVYDDAHRSRINYEFYYFADGNEKKRFDTEPLLHCGLLTDPVTRQRFQPDTASPRLRHEGIPFYFASETSKATFAAQPDSFAVPKAKMLNMKNDMKK